MAKEKWLKDYTREYGASPSEWLKEMLNEQDSKQDKDFETQDTSEPMMEATTSSRPERPRTLKAGYDYSTNTMYVVFRDGTWWEYNEVPMDMWEEFKDAPSKGRYLRNSGLDSWGDMGPANIGKMPRHRRVQMNEISAIQNYLKQG